MASFKTLPERFHLIKEHLELSYKNWDFEAPHEHVVFNQTSAIQEIVWTDKEKLECLKDLQPDHLDAFVRDLFSRAYFECLIHGNLDREGALKVVDVLEEKLAPKKLYDFERLGSRSVWLPQGSSHILEEAVFDKENDNSAIEVYYQTCHYDDLKQRCLTQLLDQCLKERFFDQIRTKEQLGYMVGSGVRSTRGSYGLRFIIQSNFSPDYLELCLERYLLAEKAYFQTVDDEEFKKQVNSVVVRKLEKNRNLKQETEKHWKCIISGTYDFDFGITEADTLRMLTKQELLSFFELVVLDLSKRAKCVAVSRSQVAPASKPEDHPENEVTVQPSTRLGNLTQFKSSMPLCPFFQPSPKFLQLQ